MRLGDVKHLSVEENHSQLQFSVGSPASYVFLFCVFCVYLVGDAFMLNDIHGGYFLLVLFE